MRCTAKSKRTGEQCGGQAVTGKDKCRMHGGSSLSGVDQPRFKHGLYSKELQRHPEFLSLWSQAKDDPEIEDTRGEIAIDRAGLAVWLGTYGPALATGKALPVLTDITEKIGRKAERLQKMRLAADQAITVRHFETLVASMLEAAREVFGDDDRLPLFVERVRGLSSGPPTGQVQ